MRRRHFTLLPAAAAASLPAPAAAPASAKPLRITRVHSVEVRGVPTGKGLVLPWDPKQIPRDTRDYVITQVFTDQGLIGTSMDGDYQLRPGIAAEVQKHAEAYFTGKDPFDLEAHQANFFLKAKSPVRLCYLEIALWDIIGQACGQPLFKLWGAHASKVKPYAATVHFLKTPEQRAEDAQRFYEQGFRAIKLRQHSLRIEDDLRLARTVIDAVRGRMDVMADANQAGKRPTDPPPVWDVQRAIDTARALSYIQPDPVQSGTLTMLRKMCGMAEAFNVPVAPHHGKSGVGMLASLHLQCAIPNSGYLEYMIDPGFWNPEGFQAGFEAPYPIDKAGFIHAPTAPGLGAPWSRAFFKKHGLTFS